MSQKLEYIDAVNDVAKPYTNLFLSQVFGLSKEKYSQVLDSAQEAVNFYGLLTHLKMISIKLLLL